MGRPLGLRREVVQPLGGGPTWTFCLNPGGIPSGKGSSAPCPLLTALPGVVQGDILGFVGDLDLHTPLKGFPHELPAHLQCLLHSSRQLSGGKKKVLEQKNQAAVEKNIFLITTVQSPPWT